MKLGGDSRRFSAAYAQGFVTGEFAGRPLSQKAGGCGFQKAGGPMQFISKERVVVVGGRLTAGAVAHAPWPPRTETVAAASWIFSKHAPMPTGHWVRGSVEDEVHCP